MFGDKTAISMFIPSNEKCIEYLEKQRWPNGVVCPVCKSTNVKKHGKENGFQRYYCNDHCGTFRVTTGTIFEYCKVPLGCWFYFIFHYLQNQSCKMIMETLGISRATAYRMARLTRAVLNDECSDIKLKGIVEFDEMYLSCGQKGEKVTHREPRKRGLKLRGRGTGDLDKPPIIGACDRNGKVRLKVSNHADSTSILAVFITIISFFPDMFKFLTGEMKVFTDDFSAYKFLDKIGICHESVNHSIGEYARGEVHNNTMEGYWSVIRHWMNTYRGVSKKNLPSYVALCEFVENNRNDGWNQVFDRFLFLLSIIFMKIFHTFDVFWHHVGDITTRSYT